MKLLIELDEEYVKAIDKIRFLVGGRTDRKLQLEIIKAIKNGKPLEQEPTTKNDLGVDVPDNNVGKIDNLGVDYLGLVTPQEPSGDDVVSRDVVKEQMIMYGFHAPDMTVTEFVEDLPPVTPQFSSELDKNSKKLEKGTAKDDLVVDWENYKDVDGNCLDDLILEVLQNNFDCGNTYGYKVADEIIGLLPSVTPQPKTGHWIANAPQYDMFNPQYICSECGNAHTRTTPYCEMCGAEMVEPQESEEQ